MQGREEMRGRLELLRVLCAVAWADGEVDPEESRFLIRLCRDFRLAADDEAEILSLLQTPLSVAHFEEFARAFRDRVVSPEKRKALLSRVEELAGSDHRISPEEREYLRLLRSWLGEAEGTEETGGRAPALGALFGSARRELARAGLRIGAVGALLESALRGRGEASSLAPRRRLYVTLFGALLYRVLRAGGFEHPREKETLRSVLSERFAFTEEELSRVLALVEAQAAADVDRQHLCSEFNRISDMDGRLLLIQACFAVGLADGELSPEEEREIRLIANYLWIETQEFVRVRLEAFARTTREAS
jgi:uncharacterized tellurite resistance protein B-like protein